MKKIILYIIAFLFTINLQSQTLKEIDSISKEFCKYLNTIKHIQNDHTRINNFYQNKFDVYLEKFDTEKVDKIGQQLFYRLQRNCLDFCQLLERLYPPKESIYRTKKKPKTKLTNLEIERFKNKNRFKYLENNGNETHVEMANNYWKDVFTDSTYSMLKYKWVSDFEFELVFVESNNEIRTAYSITGDKFIYGVIEKGENYYLISSKIESQSHYELFKLYFD